MTFSVRGWIIITSQPKCRVRPSPLDSGGIPGRADAAAVNLAGLEAFHHVGRGQNNNPSVVGRIDAAAAIQDRSC